MHYMKSTIATTLCILAALALLTGWTKTESKEATEPYAGVTTDQLPQQIRSVPLRDNYDLGGEALPMDKQDVRERLDRELSVNSYWHSSTLLNIKLATKHFSTIEPILAQYGVPDDFKYLAVAESNLRNVTSHAGAKGYWQFLKTTGKAYDLEINSEVDERMHLEKSTHAAAQYLRDLKEKFGSWTLAAAAYNGGETRIRRLLKEQKADNYYELNMSEETMRYVFRIVAIKEILSSPETYGFSIDQGYRYDDDPDLYLLEVAESVASWGDYAKQYGSDYRTLKYYNPWLISGQLTVSEGNSYLVKLPKKN